MPEFLKKDLDFKYSVEHVARCLSSERLGGPCLINLTGEGETMLQKGIVELCELLLKDGHYIEFVTNLTVTKVVDQFMALSPELLKHMEFKVSFHYAELRKKGIEDKFFANLKKVQDSAASFTLELMPHDELIEQIPDIIKLCEEKTGAPCHVTIGRNDKKTSRGILSDLSEEEYKKTWSVFGSDMFDLKMKLLNVKRKEFCYAGDWTLYVNMYTGEASACYGQPYKQNIFEDPEKPIRFCAVGKHCMQPYCVNGHAHISLGVIPELEAPSYAEIRSRTRADGTQWFSEDAYEFFSSKLYESNEEYSPLRKKINYALWYAKTASAAARHPEKVIRKLKYIKIRKEEENK